MVANPLDKIDNIPNKTSRYLSLVGFVGVAFLMIFIANEQVKIGLNLERALIIIADRQEDAAEDREIITDILNDTDESLNTTENLLLHILDAADLEADTNSNLHKLLDQHNFTVITLANITDKLDELAKVH